MRATEIAAFQIVARRIIRIGLGAVVSAAIALGAFGLGAPAQAADPPVFSASGVAIRGYDPVAYFTEAKPVRGKAEFAHSWNGTTWHFASAEHRDRFKAEPAKYAPQYGGYCAYAVSKGYVAPIDPTAWRIVDGKLYLNYNADIQKTWSSDVAGYIRRGDANWPKVLK